MALDSYNSTYPVSYYEVGTCYSFYSGTDITRAEAVVELVEAFASKLEECYEDNEKLITSGSSNYNHMVDRRIGVVVDIDAEGKILTVMFKNADSSYSVTKYMVEGTDAVTNNSELVQPGFYSNKQEGPTTKPKKASKTKPEGPTAVAPEGPTAVKPEGPTAVAPEGPTAVKPEGPTAVAQEGPTAVVQEGPTTVE